MPLSLSFVGVLLFDIASPGCGVVLGLVDEAPGAMLPLDVLPVPLVELDDGDDDVPLLDVPLVPDDEVPAPLDDELDGVVLEELELDGLVVDGLIVPVLLDDGDVLLGDVLLDDELVEGVEDGVELLSRWQPATPMAAATARTAQGFGFMVILRMGKGGTVGCGGELAESVPWRTRCPLSANHPSNPLPGKALPRRTCRSRGVTA